MHDDNWFAAAQRELDDLAAAYKVDARAFLHKNDDQRPKPGQLPDGDGARRARFLAG